LGVVVDCWCRGLLVCAAAAAPTFFLLGVLGDGLCLGGASNTFTGLGSSAAAVAADALLSDDTTASSSCGGDGAGSDHENFILQQQKSRTTCSQEIDSRTHHDVRELQDVERWASLPPASFQYDIISFLLSSTMGAPYTVCRDSKVVTTRYRESLGGNACNVAVALH
ncbi:hypothetical protein FOZ63_020571, partial [Perkinsus olseni]